MRAILIVLLLTASPALAKAGGIYGSSGKGGGSTCSSCHNPQATPATAATVRLVGPSTVVAGVKTLFTVELRGGPGAYGGVDIAADSGALAYHDTTLVNDVTTGELTHRTKLPFMNGLASWQFYWTA